MSKQEAFKCVSVGNVLAGKYRIEKILGMGGMGIVVAAMHLDLREMRALKLIRPDAESEHSIERFLREARAVVRLRSEHVPEVHDVGRLESGAPYIVMELLEGQDLSAMLKARGPLPIDDAVLYVMQACHALAEAHAMGIVHRDLKPGNLFLTRRSDGSECIKVLDFGISKDTNPERFDPEMTGAKDLIGSPPYMSPEQMRSARKVDPRADVWALGAILYKLLTGRAPFHAATVPEIFALTLAKPVRPPSALRSEIPPDLDAIIVRCLEKQLQNRYATAAELGTALRAYASSEKSTGESATNIYSAPRRTTIPPPPPVLVEIETEMTEPKMRVNPSALPATSSTETSDPMTGLARSNKIIRSGPISSWPGVPTHLHPGMLAFVALLSISSAFVGAIFISFVRLPNVVSAFHSKDAPIAHEPFKVPVVPAPPPTVTPHVAPVEAPGSVVEIAPPAASSTPNIRPPTNGANPPHPASSARMKSSAPIPAKPKITPMREDPAL